MGEHKEHKHKKHKDKKSKHKKKKDSKKSHKSHKHDKEIKKKAVSSSSSSSDNEGEGEHREYGPILPSSGTAGLISAKPAASLSDDDESAIGPQLPPSGIHALNASTDESSGKDEKSGSQMQGDDDDRGQPAGDQQASESSSSSKRTVGPALPSGIDLGRLAHETAKVDWQQVAIEEEEEELDLVGPAMPGRETIGYRMATQAAQARVLNNLMSKQEQEAEAAQPKHEAWMTMMPDVKELSFTLDEMQQNRTFQRKEKESRGDTSAWTDTPADRARKEREKQLGLAGDGGSGSGTKRKHGEQAGPDPSGTAKRLIEQYNQTLRPKSLVEIHQEQMKKQNKAAGAAKGEIVPGTWDRAEINQPRGLNAKAADKMFQDASTLDGRFGNRTFH